MYFIFVNLCVLKTKLEVGSILTAWRSKLTADLRETHCHTKEAVCWHQLVCKGQSPKASCDPVHPAADCLAWCPWKEKYVTFTTAHVHVKKHCIAIYAKLYCIEQYVEFKSPKNIFTDMRQDCKSFGFALLSYRLDAKRIIFVLRRRVLCQCRWWYQAHRSNPAVALLVFVLSF